MRKIKFRAWLSKEKMMCEVLELTHNGRIGVSIQDSGPFTKLPHEFSLMQFTGLLDKNGKEIYEGDIVKAFIDFGPGGEGEIIFEVVMHPFGVNIEQWNYKESRLPEVIGNIYENSYLLPSGQLPRG